MRMTARTEAAPAVPRDGLALRRRGIFLALMAGLIGAAWAALWAWSASPYGRYLDHGRWIDAGALASLGSLCRAVPGGEILVPAIIYAAAWILMTAAMMLPTTLPILELFRRITAERPDSIRLLALVVTGYLAAWFAFGVLAHLADAALHAAGERTRWLLADGWIVGAAVLAGAGWFQFSALKYRCLEKCRTPLGFIVARWRGLAPGRESLRLGFDHGLFCVGCCWALMLLMFVVGTGSLGWMLALAGAMAVEKNLPGGRRLSAPLGVGLLVASVVVILHNVQPGLLAF
jgi:predicted metal-binding membrane protein